MINLNCFVAALPKKIAADNKFMKHNRKGFSTGILDILKNTAQNETDEKVESSIEKPIQIDENLNILNASVAAIGSTLTDVSDNSSLNIIGELSAAALLDPHENSNFSLNITNTVPLINSTSKELFNSTTEGPSKIFYNNQVISGTNTSADSLREYPNRTKLKKPTVVAPDPSSLPAKDSTDTFVAPDSGKVKEHFLEYLDYYKKLLSPKCSKAAYKNDSDNELLTTPDENGSDLLFETDYDSKHIDMGKEKEKDKDKDKDKDKVSDIQL